MGDRMRRGSSMRDLSREGNNSLQLAPGITKQTHSQQHQQHRPQPNRQQPQFLRPLQQQQQQPQPQPQHPAPLMPFHSPLTHPLSFIQPDYPHLAPGITKHPQENRASFAQHLQEYSRSLSATIMTSLASLPLTPAHSSQWMQQPTSARSARQSNRFSPGTMDPPAVQPLMVNSEHVPGRGGRGVGNRGKASARRGRPLRRGHVRLPAAGGRNVDANGEPFALSDEASDTSSNRGARRRGGRWNRGYQARGQRRGARGSHRGSPRPVGTSGPSDDASVRLPGEDEGAEAGLVATARWVDSSDESSVDLQRARQLSGGSADDQSNYSDAGAVVQNEDPFSDSIPVPDDIVIDSAAVELTNLPPDVNLDCLRYYLEIATAYTAQVESVIFRSNRRSAVIRFTQDIDVESLQAFCAEVPLDDDQVFVDANEVEEASAIQMAGLPTSLSEGLVQMMIENYILKFSIPTTIAKVVMVDDVAVIALTSSSGYKQLMDVIRSQPTQQQFRSVAPFYRCLGLTMDANQIDYTSKRPPALAAAVSRQPALIISGFSKPLGSEKYLRLFFSSGRIGGAECIDELVVGDRMVVVRYADNAVMERIIKKIAQMEQKFENDILWVALRSPDAHPLMDDRVFILSNLPADVSGVALRYFLWAKARSQVVSIRFSRRRSMAIVEFEVGINFDGLWSALAEGAFLGGEAAAFDRSSAQPMELLQVPPVTCVQVSGIPAHTSEQYVELLVDDLCSCQSKVEVPLEDGACVLRLTNRAVSVAVRYTELVLEDVQLQATPYHNLSGLTVDDELAVPWLLPPPLALDDLIVDPAVLAFVTSTAKIRHRLDEKLAAVRARLVAPPAAAAAADPFGATASGGGDSPAVVTWQVEYDGEAATGDGGSKVAPRSGAGWRASVEQAVSAFCDEFCATPIEVDARVWPKLKLVVTAFAESDGDEVGVGSEEDTGDGVHRIVLVGIRSAVKAAEEHVLRRADELSSRGAAAAAVSSSAGSDDGSSRSNRGDGGGSVQMQVKRCELLYLQYKQLGKRLKAEVSPAVVATMQPGGLISLTGPVATHLQRALELTRGMLARLSYCNVELTAAGTELVVKREGYQHMVARLKAVGLAAFWGLAEERCIVMCADGEDELNKAASVVRGEIRTFEVKAGADERRQAILGDAELASNVARVRQRWQRQAVVVLLSTDCLSVAATMPCAAAVVEVGRLWESALAQRRPVISVGDFLAFSLLRFHLRSLLGPDAGAYVSFEEKDGGSGGGEILVSAPAALSSEICARVRSVLDSVQYGWLLVRDPAATQWLTSPAGRDFLSKSSAQSFTYARYVRTERLADRNLPDGQRLVVVRGCTLLQSGQCLMIGSNARLELAASGTGRQLLYLDGQGIQNQCNDIVKNRRANELQEGNCFCTHASKWPYNGIVHVICPVYDSDPLTAKDEMFMFALVKGLECVSSKKYSSVVLPSIGSDGFGFPPAVGAEMLVKALGLHFERVRDSSIREVVLADMNKDSANYLVSNVKKATKQAAPKAASKQDINVTPNGLLVDIVRGEMEQQQADAIVNCLLGHGDLNGSGSASLRVSRAAGLELQQACRRLAPSGQLDPGRVLVTKGYSLPCKNVINVCIGNPGGATSPIVLKSHIELCLRKAEELHATTLALPALGVDTQSISAVAGAQATMDALLAHRPQTLKTVTCVLDGDDSYRAFCDRRKATFNSSSQSGGADSREKAAEMEPSLCMAVLGLSNERVADAIEKIAANVRDREASRKSSKP